MRSDKKVPALIAPLPILKAKLLAGILWDFSVFISSLPLFLAGEVSGFF